MRFHDAIVRASHNDILVAVGPFILQERNLRALKVLDRIALDPEVSRSAVAEVEREAILLADDHTRIMNAIAARNPDLAAHEMFMHIERLIEHAKRYLNIVSSPQEQVDG
jgi:DNA-binding GntR family transcriptional regulator